MKKILYDYLAPNQEPLMAYFQVFTCFVMIVSECIIYVYICKYLYDHDNTMRLLLPEVVIKKRKKQNGLDLIGHMLSCFLDVFIYSMGLLGSASIETIFGRMILHTYILSAYGLEGFLHLLIFNNLRKQLVLLLRESFLLELLTRALSVLNHFGQCVSCHRLMLKCKRIC